MSIKITKHHIGAEIISILTKGMYPDPKDALREYVQNGIDADANNIEIKIRGSSIVVTDDGLGMNEEVMKDAVRVGISDKDPSSDVGFRGIGIYSAFHLCDELNIYSRSRDDVPNVLKFDFKTMRDILNQQQRDRLKGKISGDELIDLQSILQQHIDICKLKSEEFQKVGTRVEMIGVGASFFKSLSRFEEVANYLRQVVPLHFDKENFKWADRIEKKIHEICEEHHAKFRVVDLELQVDSKTEKLYRPYRDTLFRDEVCLAPVFKKIKSKEEFFGVAWGCLSEARRKISDTELRGFLLTKQGFALGKRADMTKHFGKRTTYFDRYIGEVIVVNADLLPNAARTDFEASPLRTSFYEALAEVASDFNAEANKHQEFTLGDKQVDDAIEVIKAKESTITFNYDRTDQLLDDLVEIRLLRRNLDGRIGRDSVRPERIAEAKSVVKSAKALEKEIQNFVESRNKQGSKKTKKTAEDRSQKRRSKLPKSKQGEESHKPAESLAEVLEGMDISLSKEVKLAIEIIDEKFIQGLASNKADYLILLKDFGEELEDSLSGE
jgi:hypothetical protein